MFFEKMNVRMCGVLPMWQHCHGGLHDMPAMSLTSAPPLALLASMLLCAYCLHDQCHIEAAGDPYFGKQISDADS